MNTEQQQILADYLDRWPHSITRIGIPFDDDQAMEAIIEIMAIALQNNKPLDDSIFGLPKGVLI